MKVWPVLLDSRPAYLGLASSDVTLLGAPLGRTLLGTLLSQALHAVGAGAPIILTVPELSDADHARLRVAVPGATVVGSAGELAQALVRAEMSDQLLFIDPRCLPLGGWPLQALLAAAVAQPRMTHHLVAHAIDPDSTRESVNVDGEGIVRGVKRSFRPAQVPVVAGVAASVVPVSSGLLPLTAMPESLLELREMLVARGLLNHDVAIAGGACDLSDEDGMLAAMERSVRTVAGAARPDGGSTLLVGSGHLIDPTARLLGPVVVHGGARIEARCTVVGPAIIGADATLSAGAVLAHGCVGPGAVVPPGQVLRDRTWFAPASSGLGAAAAAATAASTRRPPSFPRHLARHGAQTPEPPSAPVPAFKTWGTYSAAKRSVDVVLAATALVVLSPVLAVVAALVWIDSRGPVFFRDTREGVGGRQFDCLKFRTMRVGASELQHKLKDKGGLDGPHFKIHADPRNTRIGRYLRAANLDELPQLYNVLVGDMSLVGPRPSPYRENQICVPWREGRLSVRPGITGLWQVCRHDREAGDFHQWIEYDLLYVQNMSMALDVKVLAVTLLTLGGKYPVPVTRLLPRAVAAAVVPALPVPVPGTAAETEAPTRSAQLREAVASDRPR